MTMQITINKTGAVFETGDFPTVAKDFIFAYGLRQILNDCHASIQRKDFESQEAFIGAVNERVKAKLAALESGDITTRQVGTTLDPVTKLGMTLARELVVTAIKAKGLKVKQIDPAKLEAKVEEVYQAKKAHWDNEAKKQLAAKAKDSEGIDLGDLA